MSIKSEFLPVKLTEKELLEKGEQLSKLTSEIENLEEAKKSTAAKYKSEIDYRVLNQRKLASTIESGEEDRLVEVDERKDFKLRRVITFRLDTGEAVRDRPMTADEYQEKIDFEHNGANDGN